MPKCICRKLRKLIAFFKKKNGSFLSVSVCARAKNVGMGRCSVQNISIAPAEFVCHGFYVVLSFEMREELEIMIFINFLLLFIASDRAASSSSFLHCPSPTI